MTLNLNLLNKNWIMTYFIFTILNFKKLYHFENSKFLDKNYTSRVIAFLISQEWPNLNAVTQVTAFFEIFLIQNSAICLELWHLGNTNIFYETVRSFLQKVAHQMRNFVLSILVPKSRKCHTSSYNGILGSGPSYNNYHNSSNKDRFSFWTKGGFTNSEGCTFLAIFHRCRSAGLLFLN